MIGRSERLFYSIKILRVVSRVISTYIIIVNEDSNGMIGFEKNKIK